MNDEITNKMSSTLNRLFFFYTENKKTSSVDCRQQHSHFSIHILVGLNENEIGSVGEMFG